MLKTKSMLLALIAVGFYGASAVAEMHSEGHTGDTGAQTQSKAQTHTGAQTGMQTGDQDRYAEKSKVKRASELMGKSVRDAQGEDLGSIEDFALDLQQGRINYVALDTGQMLGLSERLVGISVEELRADPQEEDSFIANISQQELERAQELPDENWPSEPTVAARGTQTDTEFAPFEGGQTDPQTGTTQQRDQQTTGVQPGMEQVHRASELMGKTVRDAQGEDLGKIEDLALNLQEGRIAYVALDTNGLLTERLVGVPVESLRRAPDDEDAFIADITQQQLEAAQQLPDENWPAEPTVAGHGMQRDDAEFAPFEEGQTRQDTEWQEDQPQQQQQY